MKKKYKVPDSGLTAVNPIIEQPSLLLLLISESFYHLSPSEDPLIDVRNATALI